MIASVESMKRDGVDPAIGSADALADLIAERALELTRRDGDAEAFLDSVMSGAVRAIRKAERAPTARGSYRVESSDKGHDLIGPGGRRVGITYLSLSAAVQAASRLNAERIAAPNSAITSTEEAA